MKRLLPLLLCVSLQANDKVDHFAAGFAIGAAVTVGFKWSGGSPKQSARIGFLVGTGAGVIKEGVDQMVYNQTKTYRADAKTYGYRGGSAIRGADLQDFLYTAAGAAAGSYLVYHFQTKP